jgi:hypothetical protein
MSSAGPVQEDTPIGIAATLDQQRVGGEGHLHEEQAKAAAPHLEAAAQPQIAEIAPIMDMACFEGDEARSFGSQRGGEASGIRQQMIAFQRAVLASPGIGWRVPARRGPIGGLNLRGGGVPAPYRWSQAASGGFSGRMEPKRLVGRE